MGKPISSESRAPFERGLPGGTPVTDGSLECGIDLEDISRIESSVRRWGERFLRRVWTERELAYCRGRYPELAVRFAGKEAVSKALGTGIAGLVWREIEFLPDERGKPVLYLHGEAKATAERLGLTRWAVSLTHSRTLACAMVVATSDE